MIGRQLYYANRIRLKAASVQPATVKLFKLPLINQWIGKAFRAVNLLHDSGVNRGSPREALWIEIPGATCSSLQPSMQIWARCTIPLRLNICPWLANQISSRRMTSSTRHRSSALLYKRVTKKHKIASRCSCGRADPGTGKWSLCVWGHQYWITNHLWNALMRHNKCRLWYWSVPESYILCALVEFQTYARKG